MRDYLRRTADRIWVIDCSPEGHQPDVPTRIFQAVQQPVCIVLAARSKKKGTDEPAAVKYTVLPAGKREEKFAALAKLKLQSTLWHDCPTDWRAPFLPAATGEWPRFPSLDELFAYNGSGVQPKRVWVIAPDAESLELRWQRLVKAPVEQKEELFHATLRGGKPADRHIRSIIRVPLPGYELRPLPIIDEQGQCPKPVRYAFRSFNRQWIIPDPRVINPAECGSLAVIFRITGVSHWPNGTLPHFGPSDHVCRPDTRFASLQGVLWGTGLSPLA